MSLIVRANVSGDDLQRPSKSLLKFAQDALLGAVQDAAENILQKGRSDISQAGNFGSRWTNGLQADVSADDDEVTLHVTESVPYWTVFQFGKVIQGRPLLFFKPNKAPAGLRAGAPMPAVIAKRSVTIPKKFHLIEIATEESQRVPLLFKARMSNTNAES